MAKEETTFDYAKWKAEQPLQLFRVSSGDGTVMHVIAHEPMIDAPQPILRFVKYVNQAVEVTKVTGGSKNKTEEVVEEQHTVATIAAAFNAGAWVSFADIESIESLIPRDEVDPVSPAEITGGPVAE